MVKPRAAFKSTPGGLLVSADFCQLELRLLAHLSGDTDLVHLLVHDDVHSQPSTVIAESASKRLGPQEPTDDSALRPKACCHGDAFRKVIKAYRNLLYRYVGSKGFKRLCISGLEVIDLVG
ncbi:unnamed protein product [Protopolystoma xenopodis]|uniref:DNA-directed DNA polymerase family A palm domain-containing protein n=1 Tax=Protopolystoma xenopodis TaxID=117903 RepID=A0A448X066_9PLAT|nr:unnamed protein product [Protopolystoma xenopodis]